MSRAQKWILAIGLLLMALAALFPRDYRVGYHGPSCRAFLFSGAFNASESIHLEKLVAEWMFLAALTAAAMVLVDSLVAVVDRSVDKAMQAADSEKVIEPVPDADEESK